MEYTKLIDERGLDLALEALRELPEEKNEAVRELLLQFAEPAVITCVDARLRNALSVAKEYPSSLVDVESLRHQRIMVTTFAWSCKYAADRHAAWALANTLLPDKLGEVAVTVAGDAADAVAHDAVARAQNNWQEVFDKALSSHRSHQERVFRNWLSANDLC